MIGKLDDEKIKFPATDFVLRSGYIMVVSIVIVRDCGG